METDICKNCKAKQLFQGALLSEETSESIIPTKNIHCSHPAVSAAIEAVANFDATNLSPLTTKSYQQQGDTGGGSSSSSSSSISVAAENLYIYRRHLLELEFLTPLQYRLNLQRLSPRTSL